MPVWAFTGRCLLCTWKRLFDDHNELSDRSYKSFCRGFAKTLVRVGRLHAARWQGFMLSHE